MSPTSFLHELVGCMSQGAAGNPTGAMIEAAFAHHQLPWRYLNLEVAPANLETAVAGARAMGFRGFNLSMPHKVAVMPFLDAIGQSASLIGAVNCVVRRDAAYVGQNTDGKGFLTSLRSLIEPRGKNIVLFGAGGAARAIAVELALAGASRITVVNRDPGRGNALVATLRGKTSTAAEFVSWENDYTIPPDTAVVINGTSVGLYDPNAHLSLELDSLQPGMVVADVVFNPPQTRLLRDAAARGCRTLDGLGMLVNQGVVGVTYWTGVAPDADVMRSALAQALHLSDGPAVTA